MSKRAEQNEERGDREAAMVGAMVGGVIVIGLRAVHWAQMQAQRVWNERLAARRQQEGAVPLTADDPLWQIVGLGKSTGPTDLSENVDEYLAKSYRAKTEPGP